MVFSKHEMTYCFNDVVRKASRDLSLIKSYSRSVKITPDLVSMRLRIYDGKDFVVIPITIDMVGHKLGEFVGTRARFEFKKKKKKK